MTEIMASSYTAKDITVLEGLEPVRKRPGMYIGGVGAAGLHHLAWEILDNAIDEAMNGYASTIQVTLHRRRLLADDLRRRTRHPGGQAPADQEERARGHLHRPARRREIRPDSYKTAGGLHGVGASVVNALSKELVATVRRDGALWEQRFKQGKPVGPIKQAGPGAGHRHDRLLPPRPDHLPEDRVRAVGHPRAARDGELPPQGAEGRVRRRVEREARRCSSTRKDWSTSLRRRSGARGLKPVHEVALHPLARERPAARGRPPVDRGHRRAAARAT